MQKRHHGHGHHKKNYTPVQHKAEAKVEHITERRMEPQIVHKIEPEQQSEPVPEQISRPKHTGKRGFLFLWGFFLYIFVHLNIIASQNINPLYFSLVSGDLSANTKVLYQLQGEPEYKRVLAIQKDIYGQDIDSEISNMNNLRQVNIAELEVALQKNPKAKEVLYALSILHKQNFETGIANDYLRRAREIDPLLK